MTVRLKIDSEQQARLLTLEIDQIQRCRNAAGVACNLRTPRQRHPGAFRKFEIERWPDEHALPGQAVEPDAIILLQVTRFAADENSRSNLRHQGNGNAS